MLSRLLFAAVIAGVVLAWLPSATLAVDVPKWSTYDINLTAADAYGNPYIAGPSLTAAFTGPGGATRTVAGFWDGGKSFVIRFTPTVEGKWTYTTSSSDSGLNHQSGAVNAVPAQQSNHGFVRIDPQHKTSFVWDDGTRYFMWGQTYYAIARTAMVNDNWKAGVNNSAAYGLNKVRMAVYPFGSDSNRASTRTHGYPDVQPYAGSSKNPDRDVLNLSYWKKLDEVVQYLGSKGMVADLIVTSPYGGNRPYGTDAQNDRFFRYVVNRYAAYSNVIWCLANEWNYSATHGGTYRQDQADYNRMGTLVRHNDPWLAEGAFLRPLSTHQQTRIDFQFFDAKWPTHAIFQYGPRNPGASPAGKPKTNYGDEWGNRGIVYNLGRKMPVVNDEYAYLNEVNGGVAVTQETCRQTSWGIATAGGYGSAADWSVHTDWTPSVTGEWSAEPMYDDLKHLIDFFTAKGVEYWKMSSHNELKTSGKRTYVLAEPGRQYVIYAACGGQFSIDLAEGRYNARRYNPRTGEDTRLRTISGNGRRPFTMPDDRDWVVYLLLVDHS